MDLNRKKELIDCGLVFLSWIFHFFVATFPLPQLMVCIYHSSSVTPELVMYTLTSSVEPDCSLISSWHRDLIKVVAPEILRSPSRVGEPLWNSRCQDAVRPVSFVASFFLCTGLTLAATAGVSREAVDAHSAGTPGLTLFFMGPWQSFCVFFYFLCCWCLSIMFVLDVVAPWIWLFWLPLGIDWFMITLLCIFFFLNHWMDFYISYDLRIIKVDVSF